MLPTASGSDRMIPGDKLICIFVQNLEQGNKFTSWPLHITLVPWFRTDEAVITIKQCLGNLLKSLTVFDISIGAKAMFGARKNKPVNLVKNSTRLNILEKIIRSYVKGISTMIVDETTMQKRLFTPHITVQGSESISKNEIITVNNIYLITQAGDYKEVSAVIKLKND